MQKLADRLYGIHKIHGNYGRVFSEWSGIEQEMGMVCRALGTSWMRKLFDRRVGINYGPVSSDWSGIEQEMGGGRFAER